MGRRIKAVGEALWDLAFGPRYYCFLNHPHATIEAKEDCDAHPHTNSTCGRCGAEMRCPNGEVHIG